MGDYDILLKDGIDGKELVICLEGSDLEKLLEEITSIESNGGQFTWGYDKKFNEGRMVISFKKVKLGSESEIVEDNSRYFSYKIFFGLTIGTILLVIGFIYLIYITASLVNF
jgi:hypothetical protein